MNLELNREEKRLAERAFKKFKGIFYRKSGVVGWFGVILFTLGILPLFSLPEWLDEIFLWGGFLLINLSFVALCMTVIGKLYARVQYLERKDEQKGYEQQ